MEGKQKALLEVKRFAAERGIFLHEVSFLVAPTIEYEKDHFSIPIEMYGIKIRP